MADSVLAAIAAISSLAIRSAVGRWGYSGKGDYPMFGDFEAQRHWMEITASLPIGDWYRSSADNDLLYWGLDYPPLTAYVSWAFGMMAKYIYPDLVKLKISRAFEEAAGKTYMRSSVLLVDIIILIPSLTYSLDLIRHRGTSGTPRISIVDNGRPQYKMSSFLLLILCLTGPANLLVDHGHFQYNGVCIGLALLGGVLILKDNDIFGSIFFCLSLNFKQMALYYAPVFFFVLLRKCFDKPTWQQRFFHLFRIGSSVLLTFAALWWPFCVYAHQSETCGSSLLQVLSRQFPFSRGIFEDKVANIWYSASIIFDFREHFSIPQMAKMSLCLTLLFLCPIGAELISRKITPFKFFLSLINCSMAFFLASFQVSPAYVCFFLVWSIIHLSIYLYLKALL